MNIKLSSEDQAKAEALVAAGRFESVTDALHAGLEALEWEEKMFPWTPELQHAIDRGVTAMAQNDFASEADMDALFERHSLKSA
ncbi:MAG TPA: hypothetical protein VGN16_11085 [Acidobacteriaceae bacterium]|jgi:Arc/MetJ-type ribon-helix-helix transcriptional regulator